MLTMETLTYLTNTNGMVEIAGADEAVSLHPSRFEVNLG